MFRTLVILTMTSALSVGCAISRNLEFKPSAHSRTCTVPLAESCPYLASSSPTLITLTKWRAAIDRGTRGSGKKHLILIRNKQLGRPFDPCHGGRALLENVYAVPGNLPPSLSSTPLRHIEIFSGIDLGFFEIRYKENPPDLAQAVADIRKLLIAAKADFAECTIEPQDHLQESIRSVRGYVMQKYSGFEVDMGYACGRKN